MLQFLGNMEARVDAKGRIFVPAIFENAFRAREKSFWCFGKIFFRIVWYYTPGMSGKRKLKRFEAG